MTAEGKTRTGVGLLAEVVEKHTTLAQFYVVAGHFLREIR
jgi:hypothetical protein